MNRFNAKLRYWQRLFSCAAVIALSALLARAPLAAQDASNSRSDDEPVHLTVLDEEEFQILLVSKRTASSYTQINALPDAVTGAVGSCFVNGANIVMTTAGRFPVNTTPSGLAS